MTLRNRRFLVILSAFVLVILTLSYFLIVSPLSKIYADAREVRGEVKKLKDGLLLQDLSKIDEALSSLNGQVDKLSEDIKPFSWISPVPLVGNYYKDAERVISASRHGIRAGVILASSVEPFAGVLGLKTDKTEAFTDAQRKIQGLVTVMPQISQSLDEVLLELSAARREIDAVDPGRYPESFRGVPVRGYLSTTKETIDGVETAMPDIKELLAVLPGVLGEPLPKTYLVLFQNDKEIRATGGFLTAYALITVEGGRVTAVRSDDMYHLDDRIIRLTPSPPVLKRYLKVDEFFARDSNLSPDFSESARSFESFWYQDPSAPKIDGVLGIDTFLVRDFLEVLGPVRLSGYGEPFSSDNVVYQLELYADLLGKGQPGRKNLLGDLMNAMLNKTFSAPQKQWKNLLETAVKELNEKHLLLFLHDGRAAALAEKYNFAGKMREFDGDFLHINDSNFAGAKSNLYVQETVTQDYQIADDGTVTKTVTVNLSNPEPNDGWLNGTYYDWMRIYAPKGSKLINSQSWTPVAVSQELEKTVFTTYTYVSPKGSNSVSVTYELPFKAKKGGVINVLSQKQPGTDSNVYIFKLNGKEFARKGLNIDRELTVKVP